MWKSFGRRCASAFVVAVLSATPLVASAEAAPTVEQLVFEQPFLAKFDLGSTLSYKFSRTTPRDSGLAPSFEDEVKLNVVKPDDSRGVDKAVVVELFTGPRARSFGPMPATYNPVVLVLLEQDVVEMQKVLGGSPYYIRNRIKAALLEAATVEPVKFDYNGRSVDGWSVKVTPFLKDANRAKLKDFADRTYELVYSDEAPGGLYSIRTVTPKAGAETPMLVETLTLTGESGATGAKP